MRTQVQLLTCRSRGYTLLTVPGPRREYVGPDPIYRLLLTIAGYQMEVRDAATSPDGPTL